MRQSFVPALLQLGSVLLFVASNRAHAQTTDEIVVTGKREEARPLDAVPTTGNRLGLSVRETPAVVDTLTQRDIQNLGARTTEEALNRAPGVTSSTVATSPGALSLRGFTGAGRGILLLYDGVPPIEEAFFTRVIDSWMFERIEILQGPASVDFGQGALAGVINWVPKHPRLEDTEVAAQAGYGSFHTMRAAADANVSLIDDTLALRPVVAYSRSSEYVADAASEFLAMTAGAKWVPVEPLRVDLAVDYSQDAYEGAYFGTPLVPRDAAREPSALVRADDGRVLDESLRDVNYNVEDGIIESDSVWLRSRVEYQLSDAWSLANDAHFYTSDRIFENAEYFGFNAETEEIDRSTGRITHDIQSFIDRLTLLGDHTLFGLRNRLAIGAEYSTLEFFTARRFGSTSSVDPRDPDRGRFPEEDDAETFTRRQNRDSGVRTFAASVQDALNLTPAWRLTAGLRYERIEVDRAERDLNASPRTRTNVRRSFDSVTWRAGTSYDVLPQMQLFGQFSTAASPPSSLVALSQADAEFDLTTGWAVEAGIKTSVFEDRIVLGLSGFYIAQEDILTRSASDPTVSVQGGKQSSRGGELTLRAAPLRELRAIANFTLLDARFDALIDEQGESLEGNTPDRVPEQIFNAFVYADVPGLPLTVSLGVHHAGRFFTDRANTIEVGGYTTLEAALQYSLALGDTITDFTVRIRNLTDALYASYTDVSPDQLTLGPPRSIDLLVTGRY